MAGYTPVFDDVFQGSLCGHYPETAAWLFLLALADKNGCVDASPTYISVITGMPVEDLEHCIQKFCEPDPKSRTPDEEGKRLELISPDRPWGWRIINHGKYREKARLTAKSAREVEEGRNAERLRDRRGPPLTAADRLSNANSYSNKEKESETKNGLFEIPDLTRHTESQRKRIAATKT